MKKLFFISGVFLLLSFPLKAGNDTLFRYDRNEIEQALSNATQVEYMLTKDPGLSWNDLNNAGNPFIASIASDTSHFDYPGGPPLRIPSFIWGCTLGWPGLLVVALAAQDKIEVHKALWGCVAWNTVVIVASTIYIINELNKPTPGLNGCIDAWTNW